VPPWWPIANTQALSPGWRPTGQTFAGELSKRRPSRYQSIRRPGRRSARSSNQRPSGSGTLWPRRSPQPAPKPCEMLSDGRPEPVGTVDVHPPLDAVVPAGRVDVVALELEQHDVVGRIGDARAGGKVEPRAVAACLGAAAHLDAVEAAAEVAAPIALRRSERPDLEQLGADRVDRELARADAQLGDVVARRSARKVRDPGCRRRDDRDLVGPREVLRDLVVHTRVEAPRLETGAPSGLGANDPGERGAAFGRRPRSARAGAAPAAAA
jgi:hypothetical protein